MTLRRALCIFAAMLLLDVAFAIYIVETAARNSFRASAWAAALQLCNAVVVVSYAKDWRTVWPAAAGAFAGTYLALEWI